ncbi:MAG: hypothetical protein JJ920_18800 [Roseitalea sp.]|jgi:uncharacterized membrane protein YgaE (UPF0421/DUF939 family)|nr:hypothetical protein [Roseitalea sp.]MBO6722240.1 hypothetical protein [Roseitalea sp.]MBO6744968.1 hypothetical protein [Roseitalea sp.]
MSFDPVTITYYAVVCGGLGAFVASFSDRLQRIIVGALVGIFAAFVLPYVRAALGI